MLTETEVRTLLRSTKDEEHGPLIAILALTGMRSGDPSSENSPTRRATVACPGSPPTKPAPRSSTYWPRLAAAGENAASSGRTSATDSGIALPETCTVPSGGRFSSVSVPWKRPGRMPWIVGA